MFEDVFSYIDKRENEIAFGDTLSTPEKQETFSIQTDEQADRILLAYKRKMRSVLENREKAQKAMQFYQDQVDNWEHEMNKGLEGSCAFYESLLTDYMMKKFNGSAGKLPLRNGNISLKKPADKIVWDKDTNETIKFCIDNGLTDALKQEFSIKKNELKALGEKKGTNLIVNGKTVPGVSYIPQPLELYLPNVAKEMEEEKTNVIIA